MGRWNCCNIGGGYGSIVGPLPDSRSAANAPHLKPPSDVIQMPCRAGVLLSRWSYRLAFKGLAPPDIRRPTRRAPDQV